MYAPLLLWSECGSGADEGGDEGDVVLDETGSGTEDGTELASGAHETGTLTGIEEVGRRGESDSDTHDGGGVQLGCGGDGRGRGQGPGGMKTKSGGEERRGSYSSGDKNDGCG